MKITEIRLKNFKRFTDLTVTAIPETAKLVVVVGPNGSGKSSLFDALIHWYRQKAGFGVNSDALYYRKSPDDPFAWSDTVEVKTANNEEPTRNSLYVRTAYRNDPDFQVGGLQRPEDPSQSLRISRAIDNDQAVSHNYSRLLYDTLSAVYDTSNDSKTVPQVREELIGAVRKSMKEVFGDLILESVRDPLGAGAFYFEKGTATSYHYKNLSGGEKAAFDLLLDLHIKRKFFPRAVYCIDEVETHLHTKIQGRVLRELVQILPDQAQLWVTTHSLGILRAAQVLNAEQSGSVCVIDFDVVNFDEPRELIPSSLDRLSWEKMISIALDDLSPRLAPRHIVVCEGSSIGTRRKDFDAEIYDRVLGSRHPDIVFVSGGSSTQVGAAGASIQSTLGSVIPSSKVIALCDRDDKSDAEVSNYEAGGNLVLGRRNLESYLFGEDVIEALVHSVNKPELLADALDVQKQAVAGSVSRGNPTDDLKSAAGETYVGLRRLLGLTRCGNNVDAFMRDTLAPLVGPGMQAYDDLVISILKRLP